jgi:hypothetical protein
MLFKSDQLPVKLKFEATAAPVESTTVKVPARGIVPVPLKLIVIVQEPVTVLPEQLSVPLLKRVPVTAAVPNVTEPPPTTLSVTMLDTVPAGLPNARVLPDNVPKLAPV